MVARIKLVFSGDLAARQGWSIGVSCAPGVLGVGDSQLSDFAQQAYADFNSACWSASTTGTTPLKDVASSAARLVQARAYYYPAGATRAAAVGYSTGAPVVGTSSPTLAPQTCLVATLRGAFGGRGAGRVYFPALATGVTAGTLTSTAVVANLATSVANWLTLLRSRNIDGTPALPIVSRGDGTYVEITRVTIDNVFDTQRRRRDKIVATATGAASLVVG